MCSNANKKKKGKSRPLNQSDFAVGVDGEQYCCDAKRTICGMGYVAKLNKLVLFILTDILFLISYNLRWDALRITWNKWNEKVMA